MLKIVTTLALFACAMPISAQTTPQQRVSSTTSYQATSAHPVDSARESAPDICLNRKSNREVVCHSRGEWERVARTMGEGKRG